MPSRYTLDFLKLMDGVSKRLQAHVDLSSIYAQPGGVGDDREFAVTDLLREMLPTRFGVEKGRIFDSDGNLSAEIDAIVFERDEQFLSLEIGSRRLIPVESVYGVFEVKSTLGSKKTFDEAIATLRSVDSLRRYYKWTDQLAQLNDDSAARVREGVPANEGHLNIGRVWSSIIAFGSVTDETLCSYLAEAPDNLIFICVPGKQLVMQWRNPPGYKGLRVGEKALGMLALGVIELVMGNTRKRYFTADLSRYRSKFNEAVDTSDAWDCKVNPSDQAQSSQPPPHGDKDPDDKSGSLK